MKKTISLLLACVLLCCACALADGYGDVYSSRLRGWIDLARYAGEYDGYVSVDGRGGSSAADSFSVTVISKSASVWSEPRTNSKRLGTVQHGASLLGVSYDGYSVYKKDGFYAVEYNGMEGWINEDYVVLNALEIVLMESNVPAYIAPDTSSKKVGSLAKGTRYRVIGFYEDYYIVNLRGAAAAFIPMSVQHYDTEFENEYRQSYTYRGVTNGKTDMRTGPGKEYPKLKTVNAGYEFDCIDCIDGWYLLRYSDNSTDGVVFGFIGQDAAYVEGL